MIHETVASTIGKTPVVRVPPHLHGLRNFDVFVKLEYLNPFGSLKDRVAWNMVRPHLDEVRQRGGAVIESSSGNTAKALQAICAAHGVDFHTVTNRIKVNESRDLLRLMGTELTELPGTSDCYDPFDPNDPLVVIERRVEQANGALLHTSQYTNAANTEAHHATGQELLRDLGTVEYFVGGLGTTGSTRGIAEAFAVHGRPAQMIGVVAEAGDYIPGIRTAREMHEVGLYDPSLYAGLQTVTSREAVTMTMRLVHEMGLLAGPTTGASFAGLLAHLQPLDAEQSERQTAVFLACDRLEPYVSYLRERRPELFRARTTSAFDQRTVISADSAFALSPPDAQRWMIDARPIVIDVRGAMAYRTAHLPGAINLTDDPFEQLLRTGTPFETGTAVLLTCPVGQKTLRYAAFLQDQGVDARSLAGGVFGWRDAGYPLVRQEASVA